jgi:hypothetical protein
MTFASQYPASCSIGAGDIASSHFKVKKVLKWGEKEEWSSITPLISSTSAWFDSATNVRHNVRREDGKRT